jgi:flagellar hook-length control protein FliK
MAASVANVSALILTSPTTTTTTTATKLSDRGAVGGGSTNSGEFAKRLYEATGSSTGTPGAVTGPVLTRQGLWPKRSPKPGKDGAKPKTTPVGSDGDGGGEMAETSGAAGEAANTSSTDAESDAPEESDVTEAQGHESPAPADGQQAPIANQSTLVSMAVAPGAPAATGAARPVKGDSGEQQASQRGPVQSVIAEAAAGEAADVAPKAAQAGDPGVVQCKAQETATAFEKSLAASAAGPRKSVVAAPPPTQDVPQDAGVKPAKPVGPEGELPQLPTVAAVAQAALDMGADAAKEDAKVADGAGDDIKKLGQIALHEAALPQPHAVARDGGVAGSQQPAAPAEARFAETNHANIVSGVRTTLLPHGGSMQIRLDPPELGALQVMVEMRDGAMTATFQTANDDATRLLSHSLGQLKTALESQGVTVEKIQVQQAPKDHQATNYEDQSRQQQRDDANARQEQQRREMLRRMWRRISGGVEPVDLMA